MLTPKHHKHLANLRNIALILLAARLLTVPSESATPARAPEISTIDISSETNRQVIVDREKGQYLGHVTTVLLEDGKTIIAVYPKGHGRGGIVMKRSADGGRTWSDRLPVPENWSTSREVPTIHRVIDASGKKRLIMFSGLYPCRMAISEDDGHNWTSLKPVGDWGGIVTMGSVEPLHTGKGHYIAIFHDDGRYFTEKPNPTKPPTFTLYKTLSTDGGLTWSFPESIYKSQDIHLCEPGLIRSPDGKQLAVLLRENARKKNSHVIFSNDEGKTWTAPREVAAALTGDRHTAKYTKDGRLFIAFRDMALESPTKGDWVAWVGKYEDIVNNTPGQYRIRIMDNKNAWDSTYPGVEVLPDGTIVTTTYGHWQEGERPYIVSVGLDLAEMDEKQSRASRSSDKPSDAKGYRAARSVHLGWLAPEAEIFSTSMIVDQSTPGSYFMACGWNTGYFGIQELGNGRKVIIFSVWDPTKGDNPNQVQTGDRVECLFNDPAMRIRRFGGEGTGGQCMGEFNWDIGQTNRFLVRGVPEGEKTSYTGYVFDHAKNQWRKLVTFRTRTGGQPLKGLYSFVEDFRRDYKSALESRRARFADGWVKTTKGDWVALARARFTASGAEWEAKDTINAGLADDWFFLQTGGETKQILPLRTVLELPPIDFDATSR